MGKASKPKRLKGLSGEGYESIIKKYRNKPSLSLREMVLLINEVSDSIGRRDLFFKYTSDKFVKNDPKTYDGFVKRSAESMAKKLTPSEMKFKTILTKYGVSFKTQHVIKLGYNNSYILDFFIPSSQYNIDIDGGYHDTEEQRKLDKVREAKLLSVGVKTFRIRNEQLCDKSYDVISELKNNGVIK